MARPRIGAFLAGLVLVVVIAMLIVGLTRVANAAGAGCVRTARGRCGQATVITACMPFAKCPARLHITT